MSAPTIAMEGINLEAFEAMVYARDGSVESFEAIAKELYGILGKVRAGGGFYSVNDEHMGHLYTRLAGAITAFFADPKCGIAPEGFLRLMVEHTQLHAIFRASSYENADHILGVVGTRIPSSPASLNFSGDQAIAKLLLCWSLDSNIDVDFDEISKTLPNWAAAAIIAILGVGGSHTVKSYERRLMLMQRRHIVDAVPLPELLIQCAGDCYMHCSYTDTPDKHEVKRVINRKMREVVAPLNVKERTKELVRKDRPTVVIPLEWFGSYHAMYRCYAPSILQLRERFRVVGIVRTSSEHQSIDETAKGVFDKLIELQGPNAAISTFVEKIQAEEPDIIYYPSLGMAAWYVALSNYRLAPIQVISPGHPASSMSECIDYIVSDGDLFGSQENYVEKIVGLPVGTARYVARDQFKVPARPAGSDGILRVAIPAMAIKIIPPFLETLVRIRREAVNQIEYNFFPNMTGLSHTVLTKDLRRWFHDAKIYPRAQYQQYLDWLAPCDVMFSTFPFGGTNSVIDCFLLGIPPITLEGDQVHSRSDASMMRRVGLPEWMIAHSVDEYVAAALRYIDGGELERHRLRRHLTSVDINAEFFGPGPAHVQGGFLAAFEKIYEQELGGSGDEQAAGIPREAGSGL